MGALGPRTSYFAGKAVRYGVILFIILTINFLIPRMMPGDPVVNLLGDYPTSGNEEIIRQLHQEYGLDQPLYIQYLDYLAGIPHLDFGYSIQKSMKVTDLISDHLSLTIILVIPSILIGSLLALFAGSYAGFKNGSRIDRLLTGIAVLIYTCPPFLIAILAVSIFSFHLGLFPLGHMTSGNTSWAWYLPDLCYHLFLPVMVLSVFGASSKFLVIRNSVTQVMGEHFIFAARARGLSEASIAFRHVMRNILPQFISILALNFGFMVSGALLVEIVFSLDGMGSLIYDAVLSRDYPVMQASFVILTVFILAANFLADLLYGLADPRIGDRTGDGIRS